MAEAGAVPAPNVLTCDRDRKWSGDVRRRLGDAGIHVVLIFERAPNANAYAERFVRSIKEECLDRLIPIGEPHFRRAVTEYVEHYHAERNHQGLDNRLISGPPVILMTSRVRRRRGSAGCSISISERRDRQVGLRGEHYGPSFTLHRCGRTPARRDAAARSSVKWRVARWSDALRAAADSRQMTRRARLSSESANGRDDSSAPHTLT